MYNLACTDGYKYGGDETYVLDLLPVQAGLIASSSDQSLSLFDPQRLGNGPVSRVQTDHGNLTAAKVFKAEDSYVGTTGDNGTISIWDMRQDPSRAQVLRIDMGGENRCNLLSLACSSQLNAVAVGTELANHQASILIWDVRAPAAPKIQYNEVHSDDVTELTFHPTRPELLLSGSTDGIVNVCDTRITDEDEVVIQAFNHGSVHRAGFLSETEVFVSSHDEKFALYNMAESVEKGSATLDLGDIREALGCQYLANVFTKLNFAGAIIGVGSQDQEMFQLINLAPGPGGWTVNRDGAVGLPGAHGSELVRSFCFYDPWQLVLTGGEDGCIKAWKPGA